MSQFHVNGFFGLQVKQIHEQSFDFSLIVMGCYDIKLAVLVQEYLYFIRPVLCHIIVSRLTSR